MKGRIIRVIVIILALTCPIYARTFNNLVEQAEKDQEKYRETGNKIYLLESIQSLQEALQIRENGYLYYNLGLMFELAEDYPQAILAYARGLQYLPHFDPLWERKSVIQKHLNVEANKGAPIFYRLMPSFFSAAHYISLLMGIWTAIWLFLTVTLIMDRIHLRYCKVLTGIAVSLFLLFGTFFAHFYYNNYYICRAVIIEDTELYRFPGNQHEIMVTLPAGSIIFLEEISDSWVSGKHREKRGWVNKNNLKMI